MRTAIDLFAGLGGFSTGARMAGIDVLWAANHDADAVKWHRMNHPETIHVQQDLHQANWTEVPKHDLLLASPCCQGHCKANGLQSNSPKYDKSRNTAWAIVSALEFHETPFCIVENVREFLNWNLYPAWEMAIKILGYSIGCHIVDAADLGVPQNRVRLFMILSKSKSPIELKLPKMEWTSADSFLDWESGKWSDIHRPKRSVKTISRINRGRSDLGLDRFLIPYYGAARTGRDPKRPIGTITTRNKWALIDGDRMRMLSVKETLSAMSFPDGTMVPDVIHLATRMAGNAVPPVMAREIISALKSVA